MIYGVNVVDEKGRKPRIPWKKCIYWIYGNIYVSVFLSIKAFDKLNLDQASKKESYTELE